MINGCFRGHRGVHPKIKTIKMDLGPIKDIKKSHKIWTPARLKIRKGRELGGNHDML